MNDDPCKKERENYNAAYANMKRVFEAVGLEAKGAADRDLYVLIKRADSTLSDADKKVNAALKRLKKADEAFDPCLKKQTNWS